MLSRTKSVDSFIFVFFSSPLLSHYIWNFTLAQLLLHYQPPLQNLITSEGLRQYGFHLLLAGTAPIPSFTPLNLVLSEFSQTSGSCNIWSPALLHHSFSLCSSPSPIFPLWHLFHHPPSKKKKKKLNQITLFCTYSDILPFLLKASIFS